MPTSRNDHHSNNMRINDAQNIVLEACVGGDTEKFHDSGKFPLYSFITWLTEVKQTRGVDAGGSTNVMDARPHLAHQSVGPQINRTDGGYECAWTSEGTCQEAMVVIDYLSSHHLDLFVMVVERIFAGEHVYVVVAVDGSVAGKNMVVVAQRGVRLFAMRFTAHMSQWCQW